MKSGLAKAVFGAMFVTLAATQAPAIDDFDPSTKDAEWWVLNGTALGMPSADDQNRFQQVITYRVAASSSPGLGHCKASANNNTEFAHYHFGNDYGAKTGDGDRFFNWLFGESDTNPKAEFVSSCTNKVNCHAYTLTTFIGRGTWGYWLDGVDAYDAYEIETTAESTNYVEVNDVLFYPDYPTNDHSTGVSGASGGELTEITWKAGYSGVYKMAQTAFETPKYVPGTGSTPLGVGQELPDDWNWEEDGLGKEADLNNEVRRKITGVSS